MGGRTLIRKGVAEMKSILGVERFLDGAEYELRRRPKRPTPAGQRPVITISRQAGSGAHVVGDALVAALQARDPQSSPPWTMFDRDLVEKVLKDHKLPTRLAEFMPEDRVSGITDTIDELLGVHPPTWTLVRKTADTILRLAEIGNVVVIGRGGNVITDRLAYAFHVRLVGSVPRRIQHLRDYLHMDPVEAAEYLRTRDAARKRYVTKYYGRDIDDPLLYHLVINTDRVTYGEAARLILGAVDERLDRTTPVDAAVDAIAPAI
jgi:cytidylate kinase-like protein